MEWAELSRRVTKAHTKSMFNFKEGLKRKMLKVQYFKYLEIAHHLYDRFLVAYGKLPWDDEVPHYFENLFCAICFWV